ncbi:hypothetical protein IMZ48_38185, partial [Candidatus Bathyarchaeota archaeon]|nr:hypothetical protein [Candidatus Bathyarchaeota archaeon]
MSRVVGYLSHKDWETRSTAARAIGKIVEHAPLYDPNDDEEPGATFEKKEEDENDGVKKEEDENDGVKKEEDGDSTPPLPSEHLTLEGLPVASVIKYGRELLRGGQGDFGVAALDPQERLAYLQKTLNGRLGLLGRRVEDDEFPPVPSNGQIEASAGSDSGGKVARSESLVSNGQGQGGEGSSLSSRQLNVLKRKRKREAQKAAQGKSSFGDLSIRRTTTAGSEGFGGDETPMTADPESNQNGTVNDYFSLDRPTDVNEDATVVSEFKGPTIPIKSELQAEDNLEGAEWPYERLCEFLKMDLFDQKWETRHGAAMALREVARVHGAGAGRCRGKPRVENDKLNKIWLDDLSSRLCVVLMLDRFTDYSSDTSVAPIRESIGQTLGSALIHLPPRSVYAVYDILYQMVMQEGPQLERSAWAVCHGGMVGLRYVVAVRKDLLLQDAKLIDGVNNAVMKGLADRDDDVRSVSAATLIPIAKEFVTMRPDSLDGLINIVW